MVRLSIGALLIGTLATLGAPAVSAHSEFRIVGTLAGVQKSQIVVKADARWQWPMEENKTGETTTISITIDKNTKVTRDKAIVNISELKKGRSVVVDAFGDDESDLLALEIRLVPDIPARKPK